MITRRKFIKVSFLGTGLIGTGVVSAKESYETMMQSPLSGTGNQGQSCQLTAHDIPLIADVDVLVIGGSSGAVAAAAEASRNGSSVFLLSSLPYLGDDICGQMHLWLNPEEKTETPLSQAIFTGTTPPFPLHVKTVLENELLKQNIPFLYSSYLVNVLYDNKKQIAGALITNRSGCQAIQAKVIIDASLDAVTAHVGNVPLKKGKTGNLNYEFIVVGNEEKKNATIVQSTVLPQPIEVGKKAYIARSYVFSYPDAGNDFAALNRIEQEIRDITWDVEQVDSSDLLTYVPNQQISGANPQSSNSKITDLSLQALQPKGIPNLYYLSAYADVPRNLAAQLIRPVTLMATGYRLGKEAANQARKTNKTSINNAYSTATKNQIEARVRELTLPLRPNLHKGMIRQEDIYLPVLGEYDMVVLGGGTAGAPVGISASRQGIKTLTIEYLHGLGGLTTTGLIGRYWDGFREGFTKEVDNGVCAIAPPNHPRQKKKCDVEWCSDWKMEWFRKEIRKANGDIWFGAMGCGAVVDRGKVCGVVIATPFGRGVVLSKVVVDSTGSGDVAIAAGAAYDYTGAHTVAVQGAGLARRNPDDFYNNTDWTFIDDSDVLDVSRVFVSAKVKHKGKYDIGKLPQTRERRRIIAEHNVSVTDVMIGRRYPDTLSFHKSSFDTHGFTIDPLFTLRAPEKRHKIYDADVPLRTLLPKGLDGIIVTGLGTGAHRDAMPIIRMQPCLQNQGYAVGYLVATAVKENKAIRNVDVKKIQQHLVSIGSLPDRVLTDKENFPLSDEQFKEAAGKLANNMEGLEILLTDTSRAKPLLKDGFKKTKGTPAQINYAQVLAMLGDTSGLQDLIDEVNSFTEWDEGWKYTGMGQFGPCMSRLDSLIIALGNTRKEETLPAIIAHAQRLNPERTFSHFRAVCIAFETIGSKKAAPVLADLLNMPGIRTDVTTSYQLARSKTSTDATDTEERNRALKEIHLARALFRCGDKGQLGENILKDYSNDLHNHYARHAQGILAKKS